MHGLRGVSDQLKTREETCEWLNGQASIGGKPTACAFFLRVFADKREANGPETGVSRVHFAFRYWHATKQVYMPLHAQPN
jgi:hypothetical protein